MTKKERVIAAINGQKTDGVPSCFSLHFPKEINSGVAGINAHLKFFEETDTDILKIMNENLVPYLGSFTKAADYCGAIEDASASWAFVPAQIDFTKRILDRCDTSAFTLGTLHGICASGIHPIEAGLGYEPARLAQVNFLRVDENRTLDAMQRITDELCKLAFEYVRAGIDGVFYASLGGEPRYFTDEEFDKWIAPFDKQVMAAIKEAGGYCFLHICKDGLNMARYASYADLADVINWGVYEAPFSPEEGRALFPDKTLLGGLANHHGAIVDGTEEEIAKDVSECISRFGRDRFILGADCTLFTDQDTGRIRSAVKTARSL